MTEDEIAMKIAEMIAELRASYISGGASEEEADIKIKNIYKRLDKELHLKEQ